MISEVSTTDERQTLANWCNLKLSRSTNIEISKCNEVNKEDDNRASLLELVCWKKKWKILVVKKSVFVLCRAREQGYLVLDLNLRNYTHRKYYMSLHSLGMWLDMLCVCVCNVTRSLSYCRYQHTQKDIMYYVGIHKTTNKLPLIKEKATGFERKRVGSECIKTWCRVIRMLHG